MRSFLFDWLHVLCHARTRAPLRQRVTPGSNRSEFVKVSPVAYYLMPLNASVLLLLALVIPVELQADSGEEHWVAAWATSVQPPNRRSVGPPATGFDGRTLRMNLRSTIGGERLRLKICNTYGNLALNLGDIWIAGRVSGPNIRPDRVRVVTFGGQKSIRLPAGTNALSDPVLLPAKAGEDLTVDLYVPVSTGPPTWHEEANRTS